MSASLDKVDRQRLRWRSRRGLLELDLLLQRFVTEKFEQLDEKSLLSLQDVLLLPDLVLLDLCQGKTKTDDERLQAVINLIRAVSILKLSENNWK